MPKFPGIFAILVIYGASVYLFDDWYLLLFTRSRRKIGEINIWENGKTVCFYKLLNAVKNLKFI